MLYSGTPGTNDVSLRANVIDNVILARDTEVKRQPVQFPWECNRVSSPPELPASIYTRWTFLLGIRTRVRTENDAPSACHGRHLGRKSLELLVR
jgi:hypothetical protein